MTDSTPTDTDDPTLPTDEPPAADEPPTGESPTDEPPADLAGVVVEYDDGPDECTIYPAGASDDALVTEWLTAEGESFVRLDETR